MPPEWATLDPDLQDRSIALASATLHRLTGYRVGGCPVTVRPCVASCLPAPPTGNYWMKRGGYSGYTPYITPTGAWVNACGCRPDNCSCDTMCEVKLPPPVGDVYEVRLGGGIVAADQYRVDGSTLVWIGDQSGCPWPACQDMAADPTEMGTDTFAVTYLNSWEVDGMGAYAAGVLAAEFANACVGNKCRLPATVTAVSRQGITYEVTAGAFPNGTTGIREVDAYIGLWNPQGLRQEPQVWSPDVGSPRVTRA